MNRASVNIGRRIGTGQTAEIYALDSERVIKRFNEQIPGEIAAQEVNNTRIAFDACLPVPSIYELTSVNGDPAIVYERVRGITMLSRLESRPWTIWRNARLLAHLQTKIHAVEVHEPQSVRDRLRREVSEVTGFSSDARQHVLSKLDSLPRGNALCHGDFHPGNVLLTDRESVVIDWLDAGRGHPASDVARTNLILKFPGQQESRMQSIIRDVFRRSYLRTYCDRVGISRDQIRDWELPVAVARLVEDVPEEEQLRSFIESRLHNE